MELDALIEMSHKYGADADFVLAGGGNTSYKTEDTLYIKGSGTRLATIDTDGFVKMDRAKLAEIWNMTFSAEEKAREAEVLSAMMSARCAGEEKKRPSVETLLHDLFPQKLVLHVHPALVNGMTCGRAGKKIAAELFPDAIWIPSTKPGYVLASVCREKMADYRKKNGRDASLLLLGNHGIFFAADTMEGIDALVTEVMVKLRASVEAVPDAGEITYDRDMAKRLIPELRMLYADGGEACVCFSVHHDILSFASDEKHFAAVRSAFTPDHIVYCGVCAMLVKLDGENTPERLAKEFDKFVKHNGTAPKIVLVEGVGMFACGKTKKEADTAAMLFEDAMKIAVYAQSFGGPLPLDNEMSDFIRNWEAESYRSGVSLAAGGKKRLSGKISIVTGAAQGFGLGIAEAMAREGAYVVIADMNEAGALTAAERLCEAYGAGTAMAVKANVSDEESVSAMMDAAVLAYGGLDIFVNNAGIVRAGSLEEMTKANFELVTSVNYTAYFLCAKYASIPMKIQHAYAPARMSDIIEINSKSGLAGSNKNFAYAGSKFGGIGLTQSFALELAPFGIKVNAVCPGNYLDGPLWTDPERGLFVQYLKAGKVPGAKTVEDVKKYYEGKVPLGRGCLPEDIARALFYIVEQQYETGQALPVTGGQEMLK